MKKDIVLYGAFDRYNYGDNLMPILFKMFIEKYRPQLLQDYEIRFCSIADSNLSAFHAPKTESIEERLGQTPQGSLVVVVGGEVLGATNFALFFHMQQSELSHRVAKLLRFFLRGLYARMVRKHYGTSWEFPYVIPVSEESPYRVAYNTIGGSFSYLPDADVKDLARRVGAASYVSVRDSRSHADVSKSVAPLNTYPDSVMLVSDLVDDEFLGSRVSDEVKGKLSGDYLCFQASPHKVREDLGVVARGLSTIAKGRDYKIVLLPIGYASGHDDLRYLRDLAEEVEGATILHPLNLWEIMYVIKQSRCFIGTSLHGVITAMAFAIPHFGLNPSIEKVDCFLRDWSVPPFNRSLKMESIIEVLKEDSFYSEAELENNSRRLASLVKENNSRITDLLGSE